MCPLCRTETVWPFAEAHQRRYFRCGVCRLTFLDPGEQPSPAEERAHYDTHENDPADPGYRRFLDRLAAPLAERLPPAAQGLDYGSGPGPALALMMRERGFPMEVYDPFFAPDEGVLERLYDFVTCTETVEHFFEPGREFARLNDLLQPGGWLGVMTQSVDDARDFVAWNYARDPTHVAFYHPDTMAWIAGAFGWYLTVPRPHVFLFQRPSTTGAT